MFLLFCRIGLIYGLLSVQMVAFGGSKVAIKTNMGVIALELNDKIAPNTVANFLQYVDDGFTLKPSFTV